MGRCHQLWRRSADPTGLPTILMQFKWNQLSEVKLNLISYVIIEIGKVGFSKTNLP